MFGIHPHPATHQLIQLAIAPALRTKCGRGVTSAVCRQHAILPWKSKGNTILIMISSNLLIERWWWNVYILPWNSEGSAPTQSKPPHIYIYIYTLQVLLSGVSKLFQSGFKHLLRDLVYPWIWKMTRTFRHLSRAGTSSFPGFFEGCAFQEVAPQILLSFLSFSFPLPPAQYKTMSWGKAW